MDKDVIKVEDDEGNLRELSLLAEFEVNIGVYYAFYDEKDMQIYFFKRMTADDDNITVVPVQEDEEYENIKMIFSDIINNLFYI